MSLYGEPNYYPGTTEDDDDYDEWDDYDSPCSPGSADDEDDDYDPKLDAELYDDHGWIGSVKHPEVMVQLSGQDGNGFGIVCKVKMALKRAGVSVEEQDEFFDEATSGDYDHLLQTCMQWVSIA
jgi:IMP cyclohydrolase